MHVEHRLPAEPKVAKFRPWVQEIVVTVVQTAPDNSGLIVVIAGGIAALIVVCGSLVAIVYLVNRKPVVVVAPTVRSDTHTAFHGLKIL
jgi:hypothetical protein